MRKTVILVLLSAFVTVLLSGCYNYSDIEDTSAVSGIAVDFAENGDYEITAEIISAKSSAEVDVETKLLKERGRTLSEAVENLKNENGKPVNLSHCQVLFISEEFAKKGISELFELVLHYSHLRLSSVLAVVDGERADSVFECKIPLYDMVSYGIFDMMKQNNLSNSVFPSAQFYICLNAYESGGCDFVLPVVSVKEENGEKSCRFSGVTVFSEDRKAGDLSLDESRIYMLLMGQPLGEGITVEIEEGYVTLEIKKLSAAKSVKKVGESFSADITLQTDARVFPENFDISDGQSRRALEEKAELKLKEEAETLFLYIRDNFGSDIFGLGDLLYHDEPTKWSEIRGNWKEIFGKTEMEVNVKCRINEAGKSSLNAKTGGE